MLEFANNKTKKKALILQGHLKAVFHAEAYNRVK